jgi:hypothetical protein
MEAVLPARKMRIDFSGVDKEIRKAAGGRTHIPEGDYLAKIVDVEARTSERSGSKYLNWKFTITEGPHKGTTLYGMTSLKQNALWNLRNLIHAATGKNVAGRAVNFDPGNVLGKTVGVSVEDNEYGEGENKKVTSRVNTAFPADEFEGETEDEDDEEEEDDEEDEEEDLEDVEVDDI